LNQPATSLWDAALLFSNESCRIRTCTVKTAPDHLVRNGDGDELLFVHRGEGAFFCDFGHLDYREGDYLLIPRGTMWRFQPASDTRLLLIESSQASIGLPEKGLLGSHAIFDPAILDTPEIDDLFIRQQTEEQSRVLVKRHNRLTTIAYPFNPLDAIGWKGDLAVCRLNVADIRPVMSHRYHLPPSVHSTFVTDQFVVCTFCPRPMETDPGALKVPFFHSNDDFDELIFYHKGEFFSRDNISPGMLTLHPSGFPHGPHPKALATGQQGDRTTTDEIAVMIDSRDALKVSDEASRVEWEGYVDSWKEV
jgi:homogentisate 1,2-dioxygenase|tara:strand:+ start:1973 stop:2893 length:921 start_codon:yes stop_codon:yes gene_type:complete